MGSSDYEYDSGFDDTPPASPRLKRPRVPGWRRLYFRAKAFRGPIGFFVLLILFVRLWRSQKGTLFKPKHAPSLRFENVDWRLYAYSQYATDQHYLCNSLMVFDQLERLGSKASRMLLFPREWGQKMQDPSDRTGQLLVKAQRQYKAKLVPIEAEGMRLNMVMGPKASAKEGVGIDTTWDMSIAKFLTFNQTQFLRILHFDSDVTVLKHMDDIFLAPEARVAMPRAYWRLPKENMMTSLFILLHPSAQETERLVEEARKESTRDRVFDMEILNRVYRSSAMVLPHRKYGLLTGEFRTKDHRNYHGNEYEEWHPQRALSEASLVHFSDYPLPKPWIMWRFEQLQILQPKCDYMPGTPNESGCRDRDAWLELYHDFRRRRKNVCGLLSVPAQELPYAPEGKAKETVAQA